MKRITVLILITALLLTGCNASDNMYTGPSETEFEGAMKQYIIAKYPGEIQTINATWQTYDNKFHPNNSYQAMEIPTLLGKNITVKCYKIDSSKKWDLTDTNNIVFCDNYISIKYEEDVKKCVKELLQPHFKEVKVEYSAPRNAYAIEENNDLSPAATFEEYMTSPMNGHYRTLATLGRKVDIDIAYDPEEDIEDVFERFKDILQKTDCCFMGYAYFNPGSVSSYSETTGHMGFICNPADDEIVFDPAIYSDPNKDLLEHIDEINSNIPDSVGE